MKTTQIITRVFKPFRSSERLTDPKTSNERGENTRKEKLRASPQSVRSILEIGRF